MSGIFPTGGQQQRHAAVLGSPIAHSLSPVLHRAAYQALGLRDWRYEAYRVEEDALEDFLTRLDTDWAGLSLTMPLKRAVIPLLDEVSSTARAVEAVNTVCFTPHGRRLGENTDVPGMLAALAERGVHRAPSATVLGAGATASSALAALARLDVGEVTVYVRSERRAAEMRELGERVGLTLYTAGWDDAASGLRAPLVVSTTPTGATDWLAARLPERPGALFDVLYEPWPTVLAAAWGAGGGTVLSGLDLLVHQAVLQVELMTGHQVAPLAAMRAAGEAALAAR